MSPSGASQSPERLSGLVAGVFFAVVGATTRKLATAARTTSASFRSWARRNSTCDQLEVRRVRIGSEADKVVVQVTERGEEVSRRVRRVRAIRRTTALEGVRSTDATRADQLAYVKGEIDLSRLGERVRQRYNLI